MAKVKDIIQWFSKFDGEMEVTFSTLDRSGLHLLSLYDLSSDVLCVDIGSEGE